jgi:hypothetical protein
MSQAAASRIFRTPHLDDRFDHLLLSVALLARYRDGSYTVFGNDGHHFQDSVNARPNLVVAEPIANALHRASDHLPVYLDLLVGEGASSVEEEAVWRRGEMDLSGLTGSTPLELPIHPIRIP